MLSAFFFSFNGFLWNKKSIIMMLS